MNSDFKKVMSGVKGFMWFFSSALKGADAYNQLLIQQAVLDQQRDYLTHILEHANCQNAEKIVQYVIDTLTESVAKGTVATVGDAVLSNFGGLALSEVTDEAVGNVLGNIIGKSANGYMLFFDIGTDAAMAMSHAGETKLQTWAVEDAYREFRGIKNEVGTAMTAFYFNPTAENFEAMYYTIEYYSLLVQAGTKKVSDILVADLESMMSKFRAMLSEKKEEKRLADIENAQMLPEKDLEALNRFRRRLFPTLQF